MTAKEKLRRAIEELSEAEAAEALQILVRGGERTERDSMTELLDDAPLDDELETESEREAVAEGYEALRRGETVSLDEINTSNS